MRNPFIERLKRNLVVVLAKKIYTAYMNKKQRF